jgi:hypothetical protein
MVYWNTNNVGFKALEIAPVTAQNDVSPYFGGSVLVSDTTNRYVLILLC